MNCTSIAGVGGVRRSVLAWAAALGTLMGQTGAQPVDLRGRVQSADGTPIEQATVILATARPLVGVAILCPSCHIDCGRSAVTGPTGSFVIEGVDATQEFTLLALGEGWSALHTAHHDPSHEVIVTLARRPEIPENPAMVLRGRVVDENGHGVADAQVAPRMFWWTMAEAGGRLGGSSRLDGAEALAVTDEHGRFSLIMPRAIEHLDVQVSAQAMAPATYGRLALDGREHTLSIGLGGSVAGRLLGPDGTPLAGRRIGVCGTNRSPDRFYGDFWIGTDEQGRFLLPNLPPIEDEYVLYTAMDEAGRGGVLAPVRFGLRGHGQSAELGDLRTMPGFTLRGRVELSPSGPIPDGSKMMLSNMLAWDQSIVELSADGAFEFSGITPGAHSLSARVPGFHVSRKNASCDPLSQRPSLTGVIAGDMEITVLLEPGENAPMERPVPLQEQPLRGIGSGSPPLDR